MISEKMLGFINSSEKIISKKYGEGFTEREITMTRAIKLNEEIGELCSEVLANLGQQRQRKEEYRHNEESLAGEFADVLIVTLMLANRLDIDINKSVVNKINKLKKRYAQEYKDQN